MTTREIKITTCDVFTSQLARCDAEIKPTSPSFTVAVTPFGEQVMQGGTVVLHVCEACRYKLHYLFGLMRAQR